MTAAGFPMGDDRLAVRTPDPQRMLEGYAELTRIQASVSVVRRFQAAVAEERAAEEGITGHLRSLSLRLGFGRAARGIPSRRLPWLEGARFTVRLQGLALLLLLVLTLGLVAGGAGATIASAPGRLLLPEGPPGVAPTPSPARTIRVVPLAQRVPVVTGKAAKAGKADKAGKPSKPGKAGKPGRKGAAKRRSESPWVTPACVLDGGPLVCHRFCAF
jgi:hypothetical protein